VVFRPKPYLMAGSGIDPAYPQELDIDQDACQTSTTKKKVAESILEMGKKGSKGVTAKGMWMGVGKAEEASFSHSLVVPVSNDHNYFTISHPKVADARVS
jgi:hypothetical protein